jgi:hypothetical protein
LIDLIDVYSPVAILELQIVAKLRIAAGGKTNAGAGKTFVWVLL